MHGFSVEDQREENRISCSQESSVKDDRTVSYVSDFREKESIEDLLSNVEDDKRGLK